MVGDLVALDIRADGLHIILQPDGREYLESQVEERDPYGYPEIRFKQPYEFILRELLEHYACNGGPEILSGEGGDYIIVGSLTSAPVIAYDVERNDQGDLINVGRVFWYPQYAVSSELEELLNDGETVFEES